MRVAALVLACVVVLGSSAADACLCIRKPEPIATTLRQRQEGADVVFHARVVSVKEPSRFLRMLGLSVKGEVVFELHSALKGQVGTSPVVLTSDTTCDIPFEEGRDYLVYAKRERPGFLFVGFCSGTRLASADDEEFRWLRTGELPRTADGPWR